MVSGRRPGVPSPATDGERRVRGAHPALVRPVVMHLLWSGGNLVTDMGRPLGGDSMIWPPGESGSVRGAVVIGPGSRFTFDGEVVEVTGFEGTRVTLRDGRDRWRMLGLAGFLAGGVPLEAREGPAGPGGAVAGWPVRRQRAVGGDRTRWSCPGGADRVPVRDRGGGPAGRAPPGLRPGPGFLAVAEIGGFYCMRDLQRSHYGRRALRVRRDKSKSSQLHRLAGLPSGSRPNR